MIGIVIVTHGGIAREFISVTEHIVGRQTHLLPVCIGPEDDMERTREQILATMEQVDQSKGVVILTDMFGGTPSNLAISVMGRRDVEVVAGVNLPMLVKLVSVRNSLPMNEAVLVAQEAGRKYINVASNLLNRKAG